MSEPGAIATGFFQTLAYQLLYQCVDVAHFIGQVFFNIEAQSELLRQRYSWFRRCAQTAD